MTTAGRVLALRTAGKAGFLDLSDGRSRLQVYLRRDAVGDAAFELYRALDLGDWLGVEGDVFQTRTGELSVKARTLTFLAKCLPPASGEVARPEGRRAPLPAALPGPRGQPGRRARCSSAGRRSSDSSGIFWTRADISRSRPR